MANFKYLAAFLVGALIAAALMFFFLQQPKVTEETPPKAKTELNATSSTSVSYAAKDGADDPDAEITIKAPDIKIKYNNTAYTLPAMTDEQHKFEKGKLITETKTEATLDVTQLVKQLAEAKRPRHAVGIWHTTDGPALSYGHYIAKNKKLTVMATVPDTKKYAAIGLEITF